MILQKLDIEYQRWGNHKGMHTGTARFDGECGIVTLNLTPEMCNKIFEVCADGILNVAREAAANLVCNVIEQKKSLGEK